MRTAAILALLLAACATPPLDEERRLEDFALMAAEADAEEPRTQSPFEPVLPEKVAKDWVKMKSGEWLRGEITVLRDKTLEFDSDEFDDVNLEWKDVKELRSPRPVTVTFDDRTTVTGALLVRGDKILIGQKEFERDKILSIVPGEPKESNYWSGKLTFGFTIRAGNVNQTDTNARLFVRRRGPYHKLEFEYTHYMTEIEGENTADNQRFTGSWNYFISRKWFLTPAYLELYRDPFQNTSLRVMPAVSVGYHLFDTSRVMWDISLGAGYRWTQFDSVEPGEDDADSTAAVLPATTLEVDITKKVEFRLDTSAQIGVPDTEDTNINFLATLSYEFLKDFDLDLSLQWNRVGQPTSDSEGDTPSTDDVRLSFGIAWDF
jgi:putative salt-induced outer membrane protein YdiY